VKENAPNKSQQNKESVDMKTHRFLPLLLMVVFLSTSGCSKETDDKTADNKANSKHIYQINLIHFSELIVNNFEEKIRNGIKSTGLIEGKDYKIRKLSAQNDMGMLSSMIDASISDKADIIIAFHAQTLYAAINKIKDTPIIFSIISNPYILGAGKSESEHLTNVTGMYYVPPTDILIQAISKCQPRMKKIGIVFQIGDIESAFQRENIIETAKQYNIEIESVGFTTVAEIQESINTLVNKKVDGVMMNYDSYYDIVFPILAKKSQECKIPFFAYGHFDVLKSGPVIVATKHTVNTEAYFAEMIKRIMDGEKPGNIPFVSNKDNKSDIFINLKKAEELGMTIPEELKREADKTISD
jgi:putative tryptophan/tyrosine transport system permease protein